MAGFSVGFTGDRADYGSAMAVGQIRIGDFEEYFHAEIGFWSVADYEASWQVALRRLVAGAQTSCLTTSLTDPRTANFVEGWRLYRSEDVVYVHNNLIFTDDLGHAFAPAALWESIPPRETVDEDGRKISEWRAAIADIRDFLDQPA